MQNNLKISLVADLNVGLSIGEINDKIKAIAKSGMLKPLSLKVDIDKNLTKSMAEFTKAAKQLNSIINDQNKILKTETKTFQNSSGAVTEQTRQHLLNGEIITKVTQQTGKLIDTQNKEINTTNKLTKSVEELSAARLKSESIRYNKDGNVDSTSERRGDEYSTLTSTTRGGKTTHKIDNNHEKLLQDEMKIINQMADFREQSQKRIEQQERDWNATQQKFIQSNADLQRKVDSETLENRKKYEDWWTKSLREREISAQSKNLEIEAKRIKDIDAAESLAYQEKLKREEHIHGKRIHDQKRAYDLARIEDDKFNKKRLANEQEFSRRQQKSLNELAIAQQKYGHHKQVKAGLADTEAQIRAVTMAQGDWNNSFKNIDSSVKKTTAGFKAIRNESIGIADGMGTALLKVPIWLAATTAIFAPIQGLRAAVDTILEVDKQITELKRVMNEDTNFDNLLSGSIDLAKELGRSITEVNVALTGFARQGFNENEILALTESATLAQNISELSADESMDALTAAMVVFNIEASKSISIVDKLNEINICLLA